MSGKKQKAMSMSGKKQTLVIDLCDSAESDDFQVQVTMSNRSSLGGKQKTNNNQTNNEVDLTNESKGKDPNINGQEDLILEVEESDEVKKKATEDRKEEEKIEDEERNGINTGDRKRKAEEVSNEENKPTTQSMEAMLDGSYYRKTQQRPRYRVTRRNHNRRDKTESTTTEKDNDKNEETWANATGTTYPVPVGNKIYYRELASDRQPLIRIFKFHGDRHPPLQDHLEDLLQSFLDNKHPSVTADVNSVYSHGPNELRDTVTVSEAIKDGSRLARIDFYCSTHKDYATTDYTTLCLQSVETHVMYTMGKGTLSLIIASNELHIFKVKDNLWYFEKTKTLLPGNPNDLVCVRPCTITQHLDDRNFINSYPVF